MSDNPDHVNPNPYVFPVESFKDGLHITASIGGGAKTKFVVDTGSHGIVVGPDYVGPLVCKTDKTFQFAYSSSGNQFSGIWAVACVVFHSPNGEATTRPMWIRLALKHWKLGEHTEEENPKVKMLGVGFDRDEYPDPTIPRDINPFLLLDEVVRGKLKPGYVLSTTQIQLGITEESAKGFELVRLRRHSKPEPDWTAPMVRVSVPTASITFDAELLLDTGLGYCIVQAPYRVDPKLKGQTTEVENGQKIEISTLDPPKTIYSFVVGDEEAPQAVSWRHCLHNGVPFINTSRFALSQADYLYDAKDGLLGFRVHKGGERVG